MLTILGRRLRRALCPRTRDEREDGGLDGRDQKRGKGLLRGHGNGQGHRAESEEEKMQ